MSHSKPFSTSAKTICSYVETPAVRKLEASFGDKLSGLSQEEKYQLCTAIALMLWGCCDSGTEEDKDPEGYSDLDIFGMDLSDGEPDLITTQNDQLVPEVTAHVMTALVILQNEPPEILAQLLPAVAEYARDDDR